jgi:hypothetical protein
MLPEEPPGPIKFEDATEARRYVYGVLRTMLEYELTDRHGWIFGGIEHEMDLQRLRAAIRDVSAVLQRKREGRR